MTENEFPSECDVPETCKDDLMLGLVSFFDKIEESERDQIMTNDESADE